jgi:M6 family metalloprotease-like protein
MRKLVKRKLIFILGLMLAAAILQPTPANAQINLASIGFYPSVIAGSQYEIELGLTAPQNIRVTSYLQGPKKERISGLAKLKSGSLKNGKWALIFNIRENTRAGNYKIYIKATSGKSVWIDQDRFVVVQKKPQVDNQQASSDNRGSNPNSNTSSVYDAASSDHLESLPTFVYGLGKSCDTSSGKCPALTPEASLEVQVECKIKDVTYPNDSSLYVSSAFTTPPYSLAGRSKIDLSWFPVSFKDGPMPEQLYQSAVKTAKEAEGFYEFNSYGRVDFNFTVPDKDNWIALPETVNFYENLWASMTSQQVAQYLIDRAGPRGAAATDAIMFLFPEGKYSVTSNSYYDKDFQLKLQNGLIPSARVYGIGGQIDSIGVNGFTHGIGHAMYSFEDLYIFANYSSSGKTEQPGNGWDVMIGGGEFFLWQKWHVGWLKDAEVNCVTSSSEPRTLYLEPFQSPSGKKLIVVKVNSSKVILAEYRTNTAKSILKKYNLCQKGGVSQCESKYEHSGLLVYDLDTSRKHGAGPFKVSRDSKEKLLVVGETLIHEGHKFEVLGSDGTGIYVRVAKI